MCKIGADVITGPLSAIYGLLNIPQQILALNLLLDFEDGTK
jgi:hypothetical protein